MSAAKLEIDWEKTDSQFGFSAPVRIVAELERGVTPGAYTRALSSNPSAARCPHCESIIYSRRNKLCGVCDQVLPREILFNPIEAERIENLLAQERQRHRRWLQRNAGIR